MKRNIVTRSAVPYPPYATDLVCIPTPATPFILGALWLKSQKYWYSTEADYHRGRKLLALVGREALMPCGQGIINSVDRVYVLLDAALNGHDRSVTGDGTDASPFVYDPPLSQEGEPFSYEVPGLRAHTKSTYNLVDNLVTGATSPDAGGEAIPNAKLQAILDALAALGPDDGPTFEQIAQVITILGA